MNCLLAGDSKSGPEPNLCKSRTGAPNAAADSEQPSSRRRLEATGRHRHSRSPLRLVFGFALVLIALALGLATPAQAQEADDDDEVAESADVELTKRQVPDYDGRGEEPTTFAEGALWVPRVIFFPVYLVSEYVVRRPLGWVVTEAERNDWPKLVFDFFTFKEGRIGIIPTAFYQLGMRPSAGVYAWWDDFLVRNNSILLRYAIGGPDLHQLNFRDRYSFNIDTLAASVSARFAFSMRPDRSFHGLGYDTYDATRARWADRVIEGGLEFETELNQYFDVRIGSEIKSQRYDPGECCDGNPTIDVAVEQGLFESPPGYDRGGFDVYRTFIDLTFDTRFGERPTSETGIRLFTHADHAVSIHDPERLQWIRYGGAVGGYVNLGFYRTLGLKLQTAFADPLGDDEIPFTQQVLVGGGRVTNAVREGRLTGRSTVWATAEYLWPIWVWLDGTVHFGVGNVFGEHLNDFAFDRLRWSAGVGLATSGQPDHSFEINFGFMGETFEQGAALDSFRFTVGANSAF